MPENDNQVLAKAFLSLFDAMSKSPASPDTAKRVATQDAEMRKLQGPNEFIGPPTKQMWDSWTPEQHAEAGRLVEILDGVKTLHDTGKAVRPEHVEWAKAIESAGGIDPKALTVLTRYKMSKQGMMPPAEGTPQLPEDTDADKLARHPDSGTLAYEWKYGSPQANQASVDHFYDSFAKRDRTLTVEDPH